MNDGTNGIIGSPDSVCSNAMSIDDISSSVSSEINCMNRRDSSLSSNGRRKKRRKGNNSDNNNNKYRVSFICGNDATKRFGKNRNEIPKLPNRDPHYNKENSCEINGIVYRAGQKVEINCDGKIRNGVLASLKKTIVE